MALADTDREDVMLIVGVLDDVRLLEGVRVGDTEMLAVDVKLGEIEIDDVTESEGVREGEAPHSATTFTVATTAASVGSRLLWRVMLTG